MKKATIKAVLMKHNNEIQKIQKENSILYWANRTYYKYFQDKNATAIEELAKETNALDEKYYQKDENGAFIMENDLPVIKEGMLQVDYETEFNELIRQEVTVHYL